MCLSPALLEFVLTMMNSVFKMMNLKGRWQLQRGSMILGSVGGWDIWNSSFLVWSPSVSLWNPSYLVWNPSYLVWRCPLLLHFCSVSLYIQSLFTDLSPRLLHLYSFLTPILLWFYSVFTLLCFHHFSQAPQTVKGSTGFPYAFHIKFI